MDDKKLVVTSNKFLENKCKLTLMEEKILLCVIAKINPFDIDIEAIRYRITDFAKLIGISDDSHTRIHTACKSLMTKTVSFTNDDGDTISASLMAEVKTSPRSGVVEFEISPSLRKEFIELRRNFTQYELENILKLQSRHAIRIYELTKQYESLGIRTLPIDKLKKFLGIENSYPLFSNLEARVLTPSVDEVNKSTDLNLKYVKNKKGRTIQSVAFHISKKSPDGEVELLPPVESTLELAGKQIGGISDSNKLDLNSYLKDIPERIINMILEYTEIFELRKLLLDFAYHCSFRGDPLSPPSLKLEFAVLDSVKNEYDDPNVVLELQKSIINHSVKYKKTFLYTLQQIKEHEDNLIRSK
jgi:hypothetical protein